MTLAELYKSKLGTDFTNDNTIPDRVSCAFALTTILHEYDPSIPIMVGTYELWRFMQNSPKFERVYEPQAGDICVSPTGTSPLDGVVGHTGGYISANEICSNSSPTGLWTQNYTREGWRKYFHEYLKLPTYLFRLKA